MACLVSATYECNVILRTSSFLSRRPTTHGGNLSLAMRSIHWFRKGLRLHDNPAAMRACDDAKAVYALFILDPRFADENKVGAVRLSSVPSPNCPRPLWPQHQRRLTLSMAQV